MTVFCDVPYGLVDTDRPFKGVQCLHNQSDDVNTSTFASSLIP